jgi:hypothetical protein
MESILKNHAGCRFIFFIGRGAGVYCGHGENHSDPDTSADAGTREAQQKDD